MAVKVECSICGKVISSVVNKEDLSKITGDEICTGCTKKIQDTIAFVKGEAEQQVSQLRMKKELVLQQIDKVNRNVEKCIADCHGIARVMTSELERRKEDLFAGKKLPDMSNDSKQLS